MKLIKLRDIDEISGYEVLDYKDRTIGIGKTELEAWRNACCFYSIRIVDIESRCQDYLGE